MMMRKIGRVNMMSEKIKMIKNNGFFGFLLFKLMPQN